MKHVLTFICLFCLYWSIGAAWCFFTGIHVSGDWQTLWVFVVAILAGGSAVVAYAAPKGRG